MWLTTEGTSGGAFAPTEAARFFFDRLASASVGLQSGFRQIGTAAAHLAIPRILSDGTAAWTPEGAEITPSDPTADSVIATPRKLAALTYCSNELIADSNPSAQNAIAESLARAIALKLDLAFFEGSGIEPEIRGLANQSGIQTLAMGDDGATLDNLDPIADALGLLAEADASGTAILMSPRNWRTLSKVKEATGSNKPVLVDSAPTEGVRRSLYGVPVYLSSQLSTTETQGAAEDVTNSIYVYDASQVVFVLRDDTRIDVDRSVAFSRDSTAVRVTLRADLVLPNPASVVRITGVIQ
jgi:HK97 family phage major capsid protein